ncbi:MAG: ABC transporter substrate-binding protein [Geminicoccaceae bacterium]
MPSATPSSARMSWRRPSSGGAIRSTACPFRQAFRPSSTKNMPTTGPTIPKGPSKLAEAGYADGFDCTFLSTAQYGMHKDTAEVCQQHLAAVGIRAKLNLPDWATRVDLGNQGQYDIAVMGTAGISTIRTHSPTLPTVAADRPSSAATISTTTRSTN